MPSTAFVDSTRVSVFMGAGVADTSNTSSFLISCTPSARLTAPPSGIR